jgi:predicted O-methyltransferase YrrM
MLYKNNETVKVDLAHAELVKSLIMCHKPKNILEFGYGGGRVTDKILEAISYNQNSPSYSVVDNWLDVGGIIPDGLLEEYKGRAEIITSNEEDFVKNCDIKFDFIFSDADHYRTDRWFLDVYSNMLNDGGILIYHDINLFGGGFPNLLNIYKETLENKFKHYLFNKNSLNSERCERGLLVIFKN